MLVYCRANVVDSGPTVNQCCANVSWLLGITHNHVPVLCSAYSSPVYMIFLEVRGSSSSHSPLSPTLWILFVCLLLRGCERCQDLRWGSMGMSINDTDMSGGGGGGQGGSILSSILPPWTVSKSGKWPNKAIKARHSGAIKIRLQYDNWFGFHSFN